MMKKTSYSRENVKKLVLKGENQKLRLTGKTLPQQGYKLKLIYEFDSNEYAQIICIIVPNTIHIHCQNLLDIQIFQLQKN